MYRSQLASVNKLNMLVTEYPTKTPMNKTFLKIITTAFRNAGWLIIGTALMILVASFTIGVSPEIKQWSYGSFIVGACFVVIDVIALYLLRDKN